MNLRLPLHLVKKNARSRLNGATLRHYMIIPRIWIQFNRFHTIFDLLDRKYRQVRAALSARRTFFNDIRALTRTLLFKSWEDLLDFMIRQLELTPDPVDTS